MADVQQENRLRSFAHFFKSYLGVMPLVTAAVSPILTMLNALPVFQSQKSTLATYSGFLGFLVVAWVFYARSAFVPAMVPDRTPGLADGPEGMARARQLRIAQRRRHAIAHFVPLMLIFLSIACYIGYFLTLDTVIDQLQVRLNPLVVSKNELLQTWGGRMSIPHSADLQATYLGIFLFAESAFVVMALREYAYGVLKISELEVLGAGVPSEAPMPVTVAGDSYSPRGPEMQSQANLN